MDLQRKLEILADAAKYDASCASSGTDERDSRDGQGLGSTAPAWASAIPMRRTAGASRC
jgi:predicted DNA-binding helix-hairpin-helix protein